uniref:Histone deacetylase n=1 Tax=Meloidogyne hapla TaxID=6305 RepID=A0A1I8BVM5_MELHA
MESVDIQILEFILTYSPDPYPELPKVLELGYARSKLATFDVEDIGESTKNIIDDDNKFIPLGIPLVNADEIQHITKDEAQQIEDINTKNFSKD